MNCVRIKRARGIPDSVYFDILVQSFQGRIPYCFEVYEETAFQWLGPIVKMFRKTIVGNVARAFWLNADGRLEATSCDVMDSWGYHPGSAWHRVKLTDAENEFLKTVQVDQLYANPEDGFGRIDDSKLYLKACREVWKRRVERNLEKFVSKEENDLFLELKSKLGR